MIETGVTAVLPNSSLVPIQIDTDRQQCIYNNMQFLFLPFGLLIDSPYRMNILKISSESDVVETEFQNHFLKDIFCFVFAISHRDN